MVGAQTVNRCDTCRIRKRKCLGQVPECSECLRSGWKCPGYQTAWKFVDETPRTRKYYSTRKYVYDTDASDRASQLVDGPSTHQAMSKCENAPLRSHPKNQMVKRTIETKITRFDGLDPTASRLVYFMSTNVKGPYMPLTMASSFFNFIPARLGRNSALDESIKCLCILYSNPYPTLYGVSKDIYRSYSDAIASLRTCIYDPSKSMDAETLAAAIVMQMCELTISQDDGKWNHLARGTGLLLKARGVKRFGTPFELAMLESQSGLLVRQSAKFLEPCFLAEKEWQNLLLNAPKYAYHKTQPNSITLRTRLCGTILIGLSSLLIECRDLMQMAGNRQPGWELHADRVIDKAFIVYENVRNWQSTGAGPLSISYSTAPEGLRENIGYEDVVAGIVDCLALMHAVIMHKILAHLCLEQLGPTGEYRPKQLDIRQHLDRPETVELRLRRATSAYEYVKSQSPLAAKPLEFALFKLNERLLPIVTLPDVIE